MHTVLYNATGFSTDYTNLENRFVKLLMSSNTQKPFRLFSTAWQEVAFYRITWGRHNLKDKIEFYQELFNSLVQRLQSDVGDISKQLMHNRKILNDEMRAALLRVQTTKLIFVLSLS